MLFLNDLEEKKKDKKGIRVKGFETRSPVFQVSLELAMYPKAGLELLIFLLSSQVMRLQVFG